ncbi:MAG: helix-turn-helix domain-containing protein [Bosea sp. (in: a-proteobacteria)]
MITPAQIRAARHLLGLQQSDISEATGLSLPTIKRAESDRVVSVSGDTIATIKAELERSGAIFVESNGQGAGVRLRKA